MLPTTLFFITFAAGAFAGSFCPARENIYPCSCTNIPLSKKQVSTSVYCHRLQSTDSFNVIFPTLRTMQIDVFHLYDSFWKASTLENDGVDKQVLPTDWLTLLKVKEFEIVDTTLSPRFACGSKLNCRNTLTQRFTAVNSSSHEKLNTLCDTGRGNKFSWLTCMSRLRHFHFSHGKLSTLDETLFSSKMNDLLVLNLTHNEINLIKPDAFKNLPRLKILDLSHNLISSMENIFKTKLNLEVLDLSWNSIHTLGNDFFSTLSFLKTFKADNNVIVDLEESQWKNVPGSLMNIDLRENPLHCDCSIRWVNGSFHVSAVLLGHCATPEEYENSLIRRASRFLNQRCVGSSIGTRYRPRPTTPSKFF